MKSILLAAAALLAAPPVFAQPKPATLETSEKKSKDVFKPEDKGKDLAPRSDLIDEKVAKKEVRLSKVRKSQIKKMRSILTKNPLYKKKADLYFRIAEKEWDEAKYRYFLRQKQYDKEYDAYLNKTLKKKPEEPKTDYSKALKEYKKLLKEYPNYKRIDEVMFYLGHGLGTAGKQKEGASYMLRLTREYPKSKYITRAYLAVAEYYFDNDLLFAAKSNYLKVLEKKKAQEFPYALYKIGYVYYNLKEYEDSIKSFQQVVELSQAKDRRKVYFKTQAFSGLALAYAEVDDGWKRARDYFRKMGGDALATDMLEKIARVYNKQDKTDEEVAVYEYLISANKQGAKVPEYADYIVAAYKKQENLAKTDEVINRFFGYFNPTGSWYTVNKTDEEAMTRSSQFREQQIDWLIGTYHTKAQELEKKKALEKADKFYKSAAKYYEMYIKAFPKAKTIYEKQFYLAEIFFYQSQDWENASVWYNAAVDKDPKGKYSKDSAYQVILAREAQMAVAGLVPRPDWIDSMNKKKKASKKASKASVEFTKRNKDDKEFKPKPKVKVVAAEQKFLDACTRYLDIYPEDKEVPSISFRSAELYINKGHYSEGVKRLEVIMEHHPKHKFAGFAAAVLFDSNYRLRRWDQMERWARYMLKRRNYKVMKKKQLEGVIAVSINNYAQELREKGDKEKAVSEWLRFSKEFRKHEQAPAAMFNAAAVTEELEKTEKAIDLYESLIKRFPKSSQATEAHFVLGALYESQTDFERAATYFEKMAAFPDVPQMADSLYNAGAIRGALEQWDRAISIYQTYVKKFPARDDTSDVYLEIARFQEKKKDWKNAQKTYQTYLKKFGKPKAETVPDIYVRMAKAYKKEGSRKSRKLASRELDRALKSFKRLPDALKTSTETKGKLLRSSVAEARFLQAEYIYADFEAITVRFPQSVLRKTLVQKAKLLQKVDGMYFEVMNYKAHGVSAGALFRIGESYYLFAKSLFDLPIPAELTEDEQIIYRAELDDQAAPLQEKAIEAMSRALKLAHKNHVYNEWSRRSATILVKLSPEAFPVLDDAVVNTDWSVPATFSTSFITDPAGKLEMMMKPKPEKKKGTPAAPALKKAGDAAVKGADKAAKTAVKGVK